LATTFFTHFPKPPFISNLFVHPVGIEPTTLSLKGVSLVHFPKKAYEIRVKREFIKESSRNSTTCFLHFQTSKKSQLAMIYFIKSLDLYRLPDLFLLSMNGTHRFDFVKAIGQISVFRRNTYCTTLRQSGKFT